MARMYGYETAHQILGARIGDLLVKSDPQNIAFLIAFKRSGYHISDVETREVDRYGKTKYFLNNLTAILENGAIVRGWGTHRDVTNQKSAGEALRVSEERFAKAFYAGPDALVISRISDGTILEANDSFVSLSGYSRTELMGKSPSLLNLFVDPADRARALAMLKEKNCVRDLEFPMRRRSGEIRLHPVFSRAARLTRRTLLADDRPRYNRAQAGGGGTRPAAGPGERCAGAGRSGKPDQRSVPLDDVT